MIWGVERVGREKEGGSTRTTSGLRASRKERAAYAAPNAPGERGGDAPHGPRGVLAREALAPRRGPSVVRANYAKDCSQTKRSIMSDAE